MPVRPARCTAAVPPQRERFHGTWQYMFIETICTDPSILEANYRNKMRYSPDYQGVDTEQVGGAGATGLATVLHNSMGGFLRLRAPPPRACVHPPTARRGQRGT
jgi:hypothetical protein